MPTTYESPARLVPLVAGLSLWLFSLSGCGGGAPPAAPAEDAKAGAAFGFTDADPGTVLASDRLGAITWGDVDAFILQLGPDRRWPTSTSPGEWLKGLTRRVAIDRLLHDEAALVGADQDPEFKKRERSILRTAYSNAYLATLPPDAPPDDDVLAELYEEHRDEFNSPERRRVLNLFKRWTGEDRGPVLEELEGFRQRLVAGENFETLAREHSDSETRHRGGLIGFVQRGHFTADFDALVFGLEVNVPSQVVSTKDGGHLFAVTNVLEARSLGLEAVRPLLFQRWRAGRALERLQNAAGALPLAADAERMAPRNVASVLQAQRRQTTVLKVGDFQLSAGDLYELVRQASRLLGPQRPPDLARVLLDEIEAREILYQTLRDDPAFEAPADQIDRTRRRQLIDYFGERRLASWLDRQPALMQAHYDSNIGRFSSPPRLDVTRLAVPRGAGDAEVMATLEAAVDRLDRGDDTLESLAEVLKGELSTRQSLTPAQLAAVDPGARPFATLLREGEHSPPISSPSHFVILRLDRRQEPVERPLAMVRDAVTRHYIDTRGAEAFSQMSEALLEDAGFQPDEAAIGGLLGG
ncbi:MAG: peptidyl-prolyl cis-trans isomerase [Acidobacteriota bacterium]